MTGRLTEIWVYLSQRPLLWLTLTVVVYLAADWLHRRVGRHAAANPVLVAVVALVAVLHLTRTPYPAYFEGAQFVHFLLGPATIALAVPLRRELRRGRPSAVPLTVALLAGSITAAVTAIGIASAAGASRATVLSLAPKSVTAAVAMGIAEQVGGMPSLTATLVILTGIFGAVVGPAVLRAARVRDSAAAGLALGTAAHGIGTARAFQMDARAGAYAALAMGLNALVTALFLPLALRLLPG